MQASARAVRCLLTAPGGRDTAIWQPLQDRVDGRGEWPTASIGESRRARVAGEVGADKRLASQTFLLADGGCDFGEGDDWITPWPCIAVNYGTSTGGIGRGGKCARPRYWVRHGVVRTCSPVPSKERERHPLCRARSTGVVLLGLGACQLTHSYHSPGQQDQALSGRRCTQGRDGLERQC